MGSDCRSNAFGEGTGSRQVGRPCVDEEELPWTHDRNQLFSKSKLSIAGLLPSLLSRPGGWRHGKGAAIYTCAKSLSRQIAQSAANGVLGGLKLLSQVGCENSTILSDTLQNF